MATLARLIGLGVGFFLGIVLHEYAHAKAADLLGDKYPRFQGRLTLNPKAHADPVGTLAMPALFMLLSLVGEPARFVFGYGKPMQLSPKTGPTARRNTIVVALAGPAVNLALAILAGVAFRALGTTAPPVVSNALKLFVSVNVFILVVNVLPIPPLDGSRILSLFLSPRAQFAMQEYSQYLLLFLVVIFIVFGGVIARMGAPVCRAVLGPNAVDVGLVGCVL